MSFQVYASGRKELTWSEYDLRKALKELEVAACDTHYLLDDLTVVKRRSVSGLFYGLCCCSACSVEDDIQDAGRILAKLQVQVPADNQYLSLLFASAIANYTREFNPKFKIQKVEYIMPKPVQLPRLISVIPEPSVGNVIPEPSAVRAVPEPLAALAAEEQPQPRTILAFMQAACKQD